MPLNALKPLVQKLRGLLPCTRQKEFLIVMSSKKVFVLGRLNRFLPSRYSILWAERIAFLIFSK